MALTNPARFGRLQGFVSPFPTPRWKAGTGETEFPNALGLFTFLQGEIPNYSFGEPFLDLKAEIRTTIGGLTPL